MKTLLPLLLASLLGIACSSGTTDETTTDADLSTHDAAHSAQGDAASSDPKDSGNATSDASSEPSDDSGSGSTSDTDALRDECVAKVNAYRAKVGAAPLTRWKEGEACADDQARKGGDDANASGTVTFHKYYGQCKETYQNECWFSSSVAGDMLGWCMDAFWAEGPPPAGSLNHYSVMTNPKAKRVACGLYKVPASKGGWWMTQDYIEN